MESVVPHCADRKEMRRKKIGLLNDYRFAATRVNDCTFFYESTSAVLCPPATNRSFIIVVERNKRKHEQVEARRRLEREEFHIEREMKERYGSRAKQQTEQSRVSRPAKDLSCKFLDIKQILWRQIFSLSLDSPCLSQWQYVSCEKNKLIR